MTSEKRQSVLQKNSQHLYVEYADNWELLLRRKTSLELTQNIFKISHIGNLLLTAGQWILTSPQANNTKVNGWFKIQYYASFWQALYAKIHHLINVVSFPKFLY